jgi:hypothetical protein
MFRLSQPQLITNLMKGSKMKSQIAILSVFLLFVFAIPSNAYGQGQFQKYFSDAANKVKAAENPAEKRQILKESFQDMSKALDKIQTSGLISDNDRAVLLHLNVTLQDNQDELAGVNGFERVSDSQLNNFSNYVVQSMEQADTTITISLVAALLILIVLILVL